MRSFNALPVSLLALVFTLPAFAEPSSPNDPFHDISRQVVKDTEPPICCLRPLTPLENTDDDILLSFEEWKARQLAGSPKDPPANTPVPVTPGRPVGSPAIPENASNASVPVVTTGGGSTVASLDQAEVPVPDAPHFRIPITDRFNYASTDCSARVHTAHKSAKFASSILSSKKDRYMLSPCSEKNQYVVVELCDDIRIDTVQMANYEFFSGVFKDFSISVAKTFTTDPAGWTFGGTYRAKNIRGIQSFHTPTSLSDFYRFIRIDFHSHYGNEYYCPVSLLRVYGLTHLEHWKWDLWESESKNRRALEAPPPISSETVEEPAVPTYSWAELLPEAPSAMAASSPMTTEEPQAVTSPTPADTTSPVETTTTADAVSAIPETPSSPAPTLSSSPSDEPAHKRETPVSDPSAALTTHATVSDSNNISSNDHLRQHTTDSLYNTDTSEARQPNSVTLSHSVSALPNASQQLSSASSSHSSVVSSSSNLSHSVQIIHSSPSSVVPTFTQSLSVAPLAPSTGGESIYRTIMNRLTALETNTSLYARFVEEHAAGVREVLRRLSEDVGRLEGIGKAQAQMYQRSVSQFERQQRRLELEHTELLAQVRRLTEEVVLEKRLGIAQLCLLLAVLVFLTLTRGSRNEPIPQGGMRSRTSSLRSWGQRTLNLSTDWVPFRARSMSPTSTPTPEPAAQNVRKPAELNLKVDFPSQAVQAVDNHLPRSRRPHPITSGRKLGAPSRPRTPVRAHFRPHSPHQPPTPTTASHTPNGLPRAGTAAARPQIHRAHSSVIGMTQSFSMGMIGPVPRSAKHWARSAHLHEVKSAGLGISKSEAGGQRGLFGQEKEDSLEGGFFDSETPTARRALDGPAGSATMPLSSPARIVSNAHGFPLECTGDGDAEASEGDGWVDTDADESESDFVKPAS